MRQPAIVDNVVCGDGRPSRLAKFAVRKTIRGRLSATILKMEAGTLPRVISADEDGGSKRHPRKDLVSKADIRKFLQTQGARKSCGEKHGEVQLLTRIRAAAISRISSYERFLRLGRFISCRSFLSQRRKANSLRRQISVYLRECTRGNNEDLTCCT